MSNRYIVRANQRLGLINLGDFTENGPTLHATIAQTEATLALAYEARTANLIAFANACETGSVGNGGSFRQAADRLGLGETK